MDVRQLPIFRFLEGQDQSFIIPVYQRNYAWTRRNCQRLWEDLVALARSQRKNHFLGTIVIIGDGFQSYTVIDGQQRLTTICILLKALHTYLDKEKSETRDETLPPKRILGFLTNEYTPGNRNRIKLKPNTQDRDAFEALVANRRIENIDSNIVSNYKFFKDKISSKDLSPKDIFESFQKLEIVSICLDGEKDNPQLIFESLNSTGEALTPGDLIRNYILMDLEPTDQERMYKDYWTRIEELTGNIAEFARNYLMCKTEDWVRKSDVYTAFKEYSFDTFKEDKEGILKDLLRFAEKYSWLVQINEHSDKELNKRLARLNELNFTVIHPYLLDVFDDLEKKSLSEKTVIKILETIESYVIRKTLVDNSTQGLNKMFPGLPKEIKREEEWENKYLDILYFMLLKKGGNLRFPDEEEFKNALITKDVYHAKIKNFLLKSLENHNTVPVDVDELTVEHIMPQKLTKDWKERLGKNHEETHKKYLHTLGNLTLTAKNAKMSNKNFEAKQRIDYKTSKLILNFKLDKGAKWNEEKIVKRAKGFIKTAKEIWPYPETTYFKDIPEEEIFDLTSASEDDFSGRNLSRLYIEGNETVVKLKSWRDLLTNACKFLHDSSPTQFSEIQNSQEFNRNFGPKKSLREPMPFKPNQFIEGNMSANGIIFLLTKICERMNYPAEDISFSIRNAVKAKNISAKTTYSKEIKEAERKAEIAKRKKERQAKREAKEVEKQAKREARAKERAEFAKLVAIERKAIDKRKVQRKANAEAKRKAKAERALEREKKARAKIKAKAKL